MTRLLAKLVVGKRKAGEIGYYKKLAMVERNIKSTIYTIVASILMLALMLGTLLAWAAGPVDGYVYKDGHADGTGIYYYMKEGDINE